MDYDFEWDPAKAASNVHKHGVSFAQAATVFLDDLALTVPDDAHSQFEQRWFTLGHVTGKGLIAVAHTYQMSESLRPRIRIISARPATPMEQRHYAESPQ